MSKKELIELFNVKGQRNVYLVPLLSMRGFFKDELMTICGFDDTNDTIIVFRHISNSEIQILFDDLKEYKVVS